MMTPEDLSALKSIFTFKGILQELTNTTFTLNLSIPEKDCIANLIKATLSELRQYNGANPDILSQIQSILTTIPDLQRFDNSIF